MPITKCCVDDCKSTIKTCSLAKFPLNEKLINLWIKLVAPHCRNLLSKVDTIVWKNQKICLLHFENKYFGENGKRVQWSIPTLFSKEELEMRQPCTTTVLTQETWDMGDHNYCVNRILRINDIDSKSTPNVEVPEDEAVALWDQRACLACLSSVGNLESFDEISKELYTSITGIDIQEDSGFPDYICYECHTLIKKAFIFKEKCRIAHSFLELVITEGKEVSNNEVSLVRKVTNLESSLGFWKSQNRSFYTIDSSENKDKEQNSMTKYYPVVENMTTIVVDIEPVIKDFQEDVNEQNKADKVREENFEENVVIDDISNKKLKEDIQIDDIDLDDVFKGFKEASSSDSSDFEDIYDTYNAMGQSKDYIYTEIKKQDRVAKAKNSVTQETAESLCNVYIKKLVKREQKKVFKKRLNLDVFKSALNKCTICVAIFYSKIELLNHIEEHNNYIKYNVLCDICKNWSESDNALEKLVAVNHRYLYHCKICNKELYTLSEVREHYIVEHKNKNIIEEYKEDFYIVPVTPERMYVNHHAAFSRDTKCATGCCQCDICGFRGKSRASMAIHMVCHLYQLVCKKCRMSIHDISIAKKHKLFHMIKPLTKNNRCEYCTSKFKTDACLWRHYCEVHYRQHFSHHCNICGRSFPTPYCLFHHQLTSYNFVSLSDRVTEESKFACRSCNVNFLHERSYLLHVLLQEHDGAKEIENACYACKILFDTQELYQAHKICCQMLKNIYPRKCDSCDVMLVNVNHFKIHSRTYHRLKKPSKIYICEICGKKTGKLSEHSRVHDPKKSLECPHCKPGVRVASVHAYVLHVLATHATRPYECAVPDCHATFQLRRECREHILKVHSPVVPFKCNMCGKLFSYLEKLSSHLEEMHNVRKSYNLHLKVSPLKGLITYPHMRINFSLIHKSLLDQLQIKIADYMHKTVRILDDFSKYIVFEPREPKTRTLKRKRNVAEAKKRKRQRSSKTNEFDKLVYETLCEFTADTKEIDRMNDFSDSVKENVDEDNYQSILQTLHHIEDKDHNYTADFVETIGKKQLEMYEQDGEKYVVINDIVYKILNNKSKT